jgi:hypothetical protein
MWHIVPSCTSSIWFYLRPVLLPSSRLASNEAGNVDTNVAPRRVYIVASWTLFRCRKI